MKPITINVQITKNPKQYEAVRIGFEASLDACETVESAIKAATAQLNDLYKEMYQPQQKTQQNAEKEATNGSSIRKEVLTFEDPRLQQIVKRMEKEPQRKQELYENTLKYFEPNEDAMKVLKLAAAII